jgi:putative membrane protein
MFKPNIQIFHYSIRFLLILGLSLYIAYLVKHDTLQYYIAPRMMNYIQWSSILLFIIAIFQLYFAFRSKAKVNPTCDCEHTPPRSKIINILSYSLLILPLLFGFLLPDTTMNSALAAKKGVILSISNSVSPLNHASTNGNNTPDLPAPPSESSTPEMDGRFITNQPHDQDYAIFSAKLYAQAIIPVKPEIFLETLTSLDLFMNDFIGKKVELSGFIYRESAMKDTQFVVARFALQCCSADAIPYGVLIDFASAKSFADDSWVKITGTIQTTTYKNQKIMKIDASQVEKMEAPKSQYVYPNLEFLEEEL